MLTATVSLAVVLAGCGGSPEAAPESPVSLKRPTVAFFAEGEGTKSADLTMRTETGGIVQNSIALPLADAASGVEGVTSDQFKHGDQLYLSLQNAEAFGSVTCRIEVDGKVVDKVTSSGGYKIATCVGQVP